MRRLSAAGAGALMVALAAILLLPAPPSQAASATSIAASCTGWQSTESPPLHINVLRTALGRVDTVPFRRYVEVVLAGEWGPTNPVEALAAGAVAAKQYAWYYALAGHWRGGRLGGRCYDVRDSTIDQSYQPEISTPSARHIAAVAESWDVTLWKGASADAPGRFFLTSYNAGADHRACGSGVTGWKLWQLGASDCARRGDSFEQILTLYYGPQLRIAHDPSTRVLGLLDAIEPGFRPADLLGWVSGDITGDRRDDLAALVAAPSGPRILVWRARGPALPAAGPPPGFGDSGFEPPAVWWDGAGFGSPLAERALRLVAADWDGDGQTDLGLLTPTPLAQPSLDLPLTGGASADRQVTYLYWIEDGSDAQQLMAWSTPTPY